MKWYWRVTIIVCLIIVGTFAVTMLEINSNWGYLFGFMIFLIDILIDKYHPKITSFLKAIWGNIWPTTKPSPLNFLREWGDIPENELLRKPPATYEECYKPEDSIRGNLIWEQEGIKFVPDKDGKYTKHLIGEDIHYVKYIPEFDDDYVIGCDPANPESKSKGTFHFVNKHGEPMTNPSLFLKEQLQIAKEKQLAYLKALYYELIELSGDVSEQSVILPKMDEVDSTPKWVEDKLLGGMYDNSPFRQKQAYNMQTEFYKRLLLGE